MHDFTNLITIGVAFFVAAASPGPATIAAATVSMSAGRKAGLLFGLGLSIGLAIWGLVAATGLGAILQTSAYALSVLKIFGGLYLLWLALNTARSATRAMEDRIVITEQRHHFSRGLLLNLSNPKAVFAWMAVLSLGLGEESSSTQVLLATSICMVLGFVIYTSYVFIFSTRGAMGVYRRTRRWIEGIVAGLFALAGFGLLRSALVRE